MLLKFNCLMTVFGVLVADSRSEIPDSVEASSKIFFIELDHLKVKRDVRIPESDLQEFNVKYSPLRVAPAPSSEGSDEDERKTENRNGDFRLPENITSTVTYRWSIPKVVTSTRNPTTQTKDTGPPFIRLDEETLNHLEYFVQGLSATNPSETVSHQTSAVELLLKNGSAKSMVQDRNARQHGLLRNPSALEYRSEVPPEYWDAVVKDFRQITPPTRSPRSLMIFHEDSDEPGFKESYHMNGFEETMDIIPAFQRCGVFPACYVEVRASNWTEFKRQEYELLGDTNFGPSHSINSFIHKGPIAVICDATNVSIIVAVGIVLAVIIIVSNVLIIVVTLRTKALRKPHGYFKISLALADLVNGAFVLPNVCSNLTQDIWFDNRDVDQLYQIRKQEPNYSEAAFFGICGVMSQVVTVYSVLLLSVDSFLSVRWPMKYRVGDLMTPKRAIALVISIWMFGIAVSALPLLAGEYVTYGLSYTTFSYFPVVSPLNQGMSEVEALAARYVHVVVYAVFVWGIPFLVTWVLTILTAYYSRGMLRTMSNARRRSRNFAKTIGRLERDIMRTVSIVLTLLTITVMPIFVAMLIIVIKLDDNAVCMEQYISTTLFAGYYILASGSFVNVIVYNACHKEFRRSTFDSICDVITFLFGRCCPKYCDMQPYKSNRYSRKNASARATTRTTLDHRKTRLSSHPSTIMSNGLRSSTWQTSIKSTIASRSCRAPNSVKSCNSACNLELSSPTRTLSTETFSMTPRDNCLSSSSAISPQTFRKLTRNRSSSFSDVFLPSPRDTAPSEWHQDGNV